MGQPGEHATALGNVADDFDRAYEENVKFFADIIRNNEDAIRDPKTSKTEVFLRGAGDGLLYAAVVVHGVTGSIAKGFVDTLRLGDSFVEGTWTGVAKDGLRLLNVIPLVGAIASELKTVLVVTQEGSTMSCTWISTVNAIAQSVGKTKAFVSLEQLCTAGGIELKNLEVFGTNLSDLSPSWAPAFVNLTNALNKLKIAFTQIPPPAVKLLSSLESIIQANPNGTLMVSIRYGTINAAGELVGEFGHCMNAQFIKGTGVVFMDTSGQVFKGAGELSAVYKNAFVGQMPILFFKNTMLFSAAKSVSAVVKSPLFNIFFPAVFGAKAVGGATGLLGPPQGNATTGRGPSWRGMRA